MSDIGSVNFTLKAQLLSHKNILNLKIMRNFSLFTYSNDNIFLLIFVNRYLRVVQTHEKIFPNFLLF